MAEMIDQYDVLAKAYHENLESRTWNVFYERPETLRILPEVKGVDVLDAGCGSGWYSRYLVDQGAQLTAFDPSERMAEITRARVPEALVLHTKTQGLDQFIGKQKFALVLSSLVLHYVKELTLELCLLKERVAKNGCLVISMHHPLLHLERAINPGYLRTEIMTRRWDWLDSDISYIRRPLGEICHSITKAGFLIESLSEPLPDERLRSIDLPSYQRLSRCPAFIHFRLVLATAG
jgi:SAM-dependent methyltransferase